MVVAMSRISKANVCPYRGEEIPDSQALGLEPQKIYRLYRDPMEFANGTMLVDGQEVRTGAWSADGKPLVIKHKAITAETPEQALWVGTVGACTFEPPYLIARPLTVITAEAQELIEADEQRELSAGYRYRADMTPGVTPDGEPYDGVMRELKFNHVAIVREGRAGPDVHVADELPTEISLMPLKHRKLIAALTQKFPAIAKLSATELLAFDEELGEVPAKSVVTLDEKESKAAVDAALDAKRASHGKDAELTEAEREEALEKARDKKAKDSAAADAKRAKDAKDKAARDKAAKDGVSGHRPANDAAADEAEDAADAAECAADEKEEAEDEEKDDDEAKDRRRARDRRAGARDARKAARDSRKAARDANPDHRDDFNSIKQGKDSALTMDQVNKLVSKAVARETEKVRQEVTAQQRALAVAIDEVAPIAGRVELHAFDSAEDVYEFALEKAGVEIEDDFPRAGLRKLVEIELKHLKAPRRGPTHATDSAPKDYDFASIVQRVEH